MSNNRTRISLPGRPKGEGLCFDPPTTREAAINQYREYALSLMERGQAILSAEWDAFNITNGTNVVQEGHNPREDLPCREGIDAFYAIFPAGLADKMPETTLFSGIPGREFRSYLSWLLTRKDFPAYARHMTDIYWGDDLEVNPFHYARRLLENLYHFAPYYIKTINDLMAKGLEQSNED